MLVSFGGTESEDREAPTLGGLLELAEVFATAHDAGQLLCSVTFAGVLDHAGLGAVGELLGFLTDD